MTGVRAAARRASSLVRAVVAALVLAPIWVYRNVVSPMTPRTCRYYPSCSAYAEQAVKTHGAVRGSWLAVRRLARCHPWTAGGVDHVPPARDQHTNDRHTDDRHTDDRHANDQHTNPASPVTGA